MYLIKKPPEPFSGFVCTAFCRCVLKCENERKSTQFPQLYFQTESSYFTKARRKTQSMTTSRSDSIARHWTRGKPDKFQLGESKCKSYIAQKFLSIMQTAPRGKKITNQEQHATNGNLKQLTVFSQNVVGMGSLITKQLEIETILVKQKPDVLVLCEVASADVGKMAIAGYCHVPGHLSGGNNSPRVSMLIKSHFQFECEYLDGAEVPHVGCTVKLPEGSYHIWGCYREWDFDKGPRGEENDDDNEANDDEFDEDLHAASDDEREADSDESEEEDENSVSTPQTERWRTFLEMWTRKARRYKRSILLGDLNFCYLRDRYGDRKIKESARECLEGGGWEQKITRETRFSSNARPSCLDQIWINGSLAGNYKFLYNKSVCSSDHNLIGVSIRTRKKVTTPKKVQSRRWAAVDWGWARQLATYCGLNDIFMLSKVEEIIDFLEFKLHVIIEKVAPLTWITIDSARPIWVTNEVIKSIERRDQLLRCARANGDPQCWEEWREAKKYTRRLMTTIARQKADEILNSKDTSRAWDELKKFANFKSNTGPPDLLVEDGKEVKDERSIAELLNTQFRTKVNQITERLPVDTKKSATLMEEFFGTKKFKDWDMQEVDCEDVRKAIDSLKNTPATGSDGIPTVVLKQLKYEIAPYLTYLCNQIIRTRVYPTRWKRGTITPIFKNNGSRTQKTNYRPVVILQSLSKVWERLLNIQLMRHLEENSILPHHQHAYRSARGCSSYWQDLETKITYFKERGYKVSLLVFDLSAAFNLVQKSVLIPKLRRIGVGENTIKLLDNFLTGRKVTTKIGEAMSKVVEVPVGTPEGGINSPTLFSLTTMDFEVVCNRVMSMMDNTIVSPSMYADDNALIVATKTWEANKEACTQAFKEVRGYFEANSLALNEKKTEILSFRGRNDKHAPMIIEGVKEIDELKLLGLRTNNKRSFLPQVKKVTGEVGAKLDNIKILKQWAPKRIVQRASESLLCSKLYYILELTGGERECRRRLQVCQNSILRIVTGGGYRTPVEEMLRDTGWLSIRNQMNQQSCYWLYRSLREGMQPFLRSKLTVNASDYRTRRQILTVDFRSKTVQSDNTFAFRGTFIYSRAGLVRKTFCDREEMRAGIRQAIVSLLPNNNEIDLPKPDK